MGCGKGRGIGKSVRTLLDWWVLSVASHLLPPSQVKDNLWKSYTQREPTRGLPKQWQAGDQICWPALQLGDDHNRVIPSFRYFLFTNPMVLELFSPLSLSSSVLWLIEFIGFGIPQSLSPFKLNSIAPWISVTCFWDDSIPHILGDQFLGPFQAQSLNFGIPQSLGPSTLNSMVWEFLNPLIPHVLVSPHSLSSACSHMTWKSLP